MKLDEFIDYAHNHGADLLTTAKDGKSYICPICGSGSGEHGSGITTKDGVHFTCWAGDCFKNADIIDVVGAKLNIPLDNTHFPERLEATAREFNITLDDTAPIKRNPAEIKRERREREAKRKAEAEKAAEAQKKRSAELKAEFDAAELATDEHPYLTEKQVKTDGTLRVDKDNTLLISAQDTEGNFKTYQRIFAKIPQNGERKKFAKGEGLVAGAFHIMGGEPLNNGDTVLLCEGYATAASIYELIGDRYRVIVGFDAGNLPKVTAAIKSEFPNIIIGIAADDDSAKHKDNNPGIDGAIKACKAGAGGYIKPPFSVDDFKKGLSDWNDYYCAYGAETTRAALLTAIANPIKPPLSVDVQPEAQTPNYSDEEFAQMYAEYAAAQSNYTGDYDNPQPEHGIRVKRINAKDLLKKEFPPIKWAVDGFLPMGLSLLGGGPKVGKSILALHLSLAVALGGKALGKIPVECGSVLYLALEDTERRLKERILGSGLDVDNVDLSKLELVTEISRQHEGGMNYLKFWLNNHSDARLVIIDTLQKFRRPKANKSDWYAEDYSCMAEFKQLADDYSVPILIIHHLKKGEEKEDWINEFSGSQGLAGAADTLLNLKRGRNQNTGILKRTGRDVEEAEFAMTLNEFNWTLEGDAAEFCLSENERRIVNFLKENGGKTPKEIADALGLKSDNEKMNLRVKLGRMMKKNKISKRGMVYFASNFSQD